MFKLLFLPIRLAFGFLKMSGLKGLLLLGLGVIIGLLAAPKRGAQLRADLQARLADARSEMGVSDRDLSI